MLEVRYFNVIIFSRELVILSRASRGILGKDSGKRDSSIYVKNLEILNGYRMMFVVEFFPGLPRIFLTLIASFRGNSCMRNWRCV